MLKLSGIRPARPPGRHEDRVRVAFRNPHARYYIDVVNEDGEVEHWDTRAGSPTLMTRRGWTRDSIRIGDRVTLHGHRAQQEGRRLLSIIWVELDDGTHLE